MIENKQKATLVINYIKKNYFLIIEEITEQNDLIEHLKKDKNYNEKIIKDLQQNLNKIKIPILSKKEYPLEEQLKIIKKKIEIIKITSEEGEEGQEEEKIEIEVQKKQETIIVIIIRYINSSEILEYKNKFRE
jgi:deoxyribodipyrimidine photolyase